MILVCRTCRQPRIVPGPRNEKRWSYCRTDGLMALAIEDMLTHAEAFELDVALENEYWKKFGLPDGSILRRIEV